MIKSDILHELLDNYHSRLNACRDILDTDEERLEEIDRFLSSVEIRSEDIKFFSPFSTDELYDGKIEKYRNEKELLLAEIDKLNDEIKELLHYVDGLEDYISGLEDNNNLEKSDNIELDIFIDDSGNNSVLLKCLDNLSLISTYILSDPMRAKNEILNCIDILKNQL